MAKKIVAWSYSRWADYDKCPLMAKYKYVDKLPIEENDAMKRGSAAHKDLAEYLGDTLPFHRPVPEIGERFADLLEVLRSLEPLVEQQWGYTTQWRPTGWFAKDTWFRSVLDVAVVYDDNTADIVDFKTGKESPTHAQQAELYAVSIFARYPHVRNVTVRFWYLDHGTESVFRFSVSDADELVQKWNKRVLPMLNDTIFAPRAGQHCKYCDFAKSRNGPCRFG